MEEHKTLEIITANNCAEYPGAFMKKEVEIIEKSAGGRILHLFSGASKIGHVRVDLFNENATHRMDVFEYLTENTEKFDTVILDPPYNERFAVKYQKLGKQSSIGKQFVIFADTKKTTALFDAILKLTPQTIIMKSWQFYILKGYELRAGYVVYYGGYRKPTFLLIMKKRGTKN